LFSNYFVYFFKKKDMFSLTQKLKGIPKCIPKTHTLAFKADQREWREIRALNGVDFRLVKAAASSAGSPPPSGKFRGDRDRGGVNCN